MIPDVSLSGDLSARLLALPESLTRSVLVKALTAGAEPIRSSGAAMAPRSSPDTGQPGHIADHIVVSSTRRVDGRTLGALEAAVAVGPDRSHDPQSVVLEFGRHDGKTAAHPFMRPAFDASHGVALGRVSDELWLVLRKAAAKGVGASFAGGTSAGTGLL